jgi:2,3-bisphosphoglycerate-independent phosphoglycerate mutase
MHSKRPKRPVDGFICSVWSVYIKWLGYAMSNDPCQISDGGVHSHNTHLYALLETAKEVGVPKTYVHFFGDGRDTAPKSGHGYCQELLDFMKKEQYGELATIVGRYYAMDRDKRWERVKIAVDGLVGGEGDKGEDAVAAIKASYDKDVTDEFLKPIIVNGDEGRIKGQNTTLVRISDGS